MAAIRSKNTKPELVVRRSLRRRGALGYRIHPRHLPGRPDVAFSRWKVAVFVDGSYWHGREGHFFPERASQYWLDKMKRNRERDAAADAALHAAGWTVIRVWDTDVAEDVDAVTDQVLTALAERGWNVSRQRPA